MLPRFYLPPPIEQPIVLDGARSHHLVRVLRAQSGDQIEVFDGEGREWSAFIKDADAKACRLELLSLTGRATGTQPALNLAQAIIKGDAMDRLLQKATELGVAAVWLLTSEFTQVSAKRAEARMAHWQKVLISAAEQSRRLSLPRLHPPTAIEQFLESHNAPTRILLQPGSAPLPRDLARQETTLIVGPEGGWAPSELDAAALTDVALHSMGNLTLRAETAPLAALAAVQHAWGWC